MIRPSEELKSRCIRFAERMWAEPDCGRLSQILEDCGMRVVAARTNSEPPDRDSKSPFVGIWQKHAEDGGISYVRTESQARHLWADVERIGPKTDRRRIVLLGESAARGQFFDPEFNLAKAMREVLAFAAASEVEVVDLARVDIQFAQLVKLMHQALALQPDVFVVFAGNNWHLSTDTPNFSLEYLRSIIGGGGGTEQVRSYCEELLRGVARAFIQIVVEIRQQYGIPTIFVLPEFNLADWSNERTGEIPFLDSREAAAWNSAERAACTLIENGRVRRAERLAQKMIEMDGGTASRGFEILARCAIYSKDLPKARTYLETARDAGMFLPVMRSPRCYGVVQEVLRRQAEENGVAVVDLPKRFSEHLSAELPGRRIFLDYCHLTVEGIAVTAASIVERLLPALGMPARVWSELLMADLGVKQRTIAQGFFLASMHNARWGQGRDIVEFQCREALRQAPEIKGTMLAFLEATLRRTPLILCSSVAPFVTEIGPVATYLSSAPPPPDKDLNLVFIESLVSTLEPIVPGVRQMASSTLEAEHSITLFPADLLKRACCSTSFVDLEQDWHNNAIAYRAYSPQSTFRVVCDRVSPVLLRLTIRVRGVSPKDRKRAVLRVNDAEVARFRVTSNWRTREFSVSRELLVTGLNVISIQWPQQSWTREERFLHIVRQLELGRVPEVSRIFGELHCFKASTQTDHPYGVRAAGVS
jgi:hypothetical protein